MTTNTFAYNGLDARVSKTDSGGTSTYRRDGAYVTDPVLSDGSATYTAGVFGATEGTSRWLHSGIKNADSRTLAAQSVEATRDYDAFGNVMGYSGTWQGPFGNAGGFGYQEDTDAGLKLLGHRYSDSSTGRFLSRDQASDGRNWATYCSNNPLSRIDNDGNKWKEFFMTAVINLLTMFGGTVGDDPSKAFRAAAAPEPASISTQRESSAAAGSSDPHRICVDQPSWLDN